MRNYLFRGKRVDTGEWIEGCLIEGYGTYIASGIDMTQSIKFLGDYCYQGYEITVKAIEVQQETIGQYTGRIDTNGIKVFEGDIVHCVDSLYPREFTGVVDFADSSFRINSDGCTHYRWQDYEVTVIGNTADGLEMVKGGHK